MTNVQTIILQGIEFTVNESYADRYTSHCEIKVTARILGEQVEVATGDKDDVSTTITNNCGYYNMQLETDSDQDDYMLQDEMIVEALKNYIENDYEADREILINMMEFREEDIKQLSEVDDKRVENLLSENKHLFYDKEEKELEVVSEAISAYELMNNDFKNSISTIIGHGLPDKSITEMTKRGMKNLLRSTKEDLMKIEGIGEKSADKLIALFRFSKFTPQFRVLSDEKVKVNTPSKAYEYLYDIAFEDQENFVLVTISATNEVINRHDVFKGTIDSTAFSTREIIKLALLDNARSIIVAHNHPSGGLTPSEEDMMCTQKLFNSCRLMNITLLDHLIVSENGYNSIAEELGVNFAEAFEEESDLND